MNKLLALADRVEKLTGPDREVDLEIELALGLVSEPYERAVCHGVPQMYFWDREDTHAPYVTPERYTETVDAAEMLVPKGWNWMAGNRDQPLARAYVNNGEMAFVGAGMKRNPSRQWFETTAAKPALALTACALRARAHGGGEG